MIITTVLAVMKFPCDDSGMSTRVRAGDDPGVPRDVHPSSDDRSGPRQTVATEASRRHHHVQPASGRLRARVRVPASVSCRRHAPPVTCCRSLNTRSSSQGQVPNRFLANVNSSSCSLYVIDGPSVCLSSVVCRLSSVTLVHPTLAIEIFGNISTPCDTLAIHELCIKILPRSSQGNPSVEGVKHNRGSRIQRFWTYRRLYLGNGAR